MTDALKSANGWLIHQYPIRDHLYLLYLLTPNGLVKAFYRLSKRNANIIKPQAFSFYWIAWHEKNNAANIKNLELAAKPLELQGLKLFMGFYLNELIFNCCKNDEIIPNFYPLYGQLLTDSVACDEILLRQFEWQLLADCGYAIDFSRTSLNQPIQAELKYQFFPDQGFLQQTDGLAGEDLLAIHQQNFIRNESYLVFKKVLRSMIDHVTDYRPLHSRQLLKEWLARVS